MVNGPGFPLRIPPGISLRPGFVGCRTVGILVVTSLICQWDDLVFGFPENSANACENFVKFWVFLKSRVWVHP